jgi:hypothetical protein
MQPTRRDLFGCALGFPLSVSRSGAPIIHDNTLLAQESAKGFRLLLGNSSAPLTVLPAAQTISRAVALRLRRAAAAGRWILIESGLCFDAASHWKQLSHVVRVFFDIRIAAPVQVSNFYVSFEWPQRTMVRTFEAVTPIACSANELIATFDGIPAGACRSIGRGGVIFLGSMLGPALAAEEREAHAIGNGIVRAVSNL